ncbi:hypothetical protein N780_15670 [Pontibacillus chungwhensis BH030062]|uniref:Lipoprotein n=1 Tax=Pontibacillus chungwhensis BH030062 TaxID=1385513 RepID=A0A0A2UZL0_9BACI|nr:hypothetical protein [Pontibacillus chungwhensis]KGP91991.1 hypothetical protein N780_15670 [Pontibacillus chungwhensis BH030062]
MNKLIAYAIFGTVLLTGCQSVPSEEAKAGEPENEDQAVMKEEEHTFDEYKEMFKESATEAEAFGVHDEEVEKWITRIIYQSKRNGNDNIKEEMVLEQAKESHQEQKDWKRHAKKAYEVKVTAEEVDRYIEEGPDQMEVMEQQAVAEALGMTPKEFNHSFDRDHYELAVLFEKLIPKLREKYDEGSPGNLIERFKEEASKHSE